MDKQEALNKIEELKKFIEDIDKKSEIELYNPFQKTWQIENNGITESDLLDIKVFAEGNPTTLIHLGIITENSCDYMFFIPLIKSNYSYIRRIKN